MFKISKSVGIILAAGATVILVMALAASWYWDIWTEIAAWLQAIGSLVIIIVTAMIAGQQGVEARRKEALAQRQMQESAASIAKACYGVFCKMIKAAQNTASGNSAYFADEFEVLRSALGDIPLHHLGSQRLIESVLKLRGHAGYISSVLTRVPRLNVAFTDEGLLGQDTEFHNAAASVWREVHPDREDEFRF